MENLMKQINEAGVNGALLKEVWDMSCENSTSLSYNLSVRHSEKTLTDDTVRDLKAAEEEYKKKVEQIRSFYTTNINYVRKMDIELGQNTWTIDCIKKNEPVRRCPLCSKPELRLKRHLETVHKDIKPEAVKFALECSKTMYENSMRKAPHVKESGSKQTKKEVNFARRKTNYKKCPLCNSLQLNLSCHLINVHDLKGDEKKAEREQLCRAPPTIPICFTKIVNKVRVMKSEEEIAEAEGAFPILITYLEYYPICFTVIMI